MKLINSKKINRTFAILEATDALIQGTPCFTQYEVEWIAKNNLSEEELNWLFDTRIKDPSYNLIPEEEKEEWKDSYKKDINKLDPVAEIALKNIYKILGPS